MSFAIRPAAGRLWILLLGVLVMLPYLPYFADAGYDRQVYAYIGMVLRNGGQLYTDAFEHKPPLYFMLSAAVGYWQGFGPWIIDLVCLWVGLFCVHAVAQRREWPHGLLMFFALAVLMRLPHIFEGGGMTRGLTSALNILALTLSLLATPGPRVSACLGGLWCASFLTQPEASLSGLFALVIFLVRSRSWGALGWMSAGMAAVGISVGSFIAYNTSFTALWTHVVTFNQFYQQGSLAWAERPVHLFHTLNHLRLLWPLLTLAALSFAFFPKEGRDKKLLGVLWGYVGLECVAAISVGRFAYSAHYLLGLLFALALLTGQVLAWAHDRLGRRSLALFLLLIVMFPIHRWALGMAKLNTTHSAERAELRRTLGPLLSPLRGQEGALWVLNRPQWLWLNTEYDLVAPSPYMHMHFWKWNGFDPDGSRLNQELEKIRNTLVIDCLSQDATFSVAHRMTTEAFLTQHCSDLDLRIPNDCRALQCKLASSGGNA